MRWRHLTSCACVPLAWAALFSCGGRGSASSGAVDDGGLTHNTLFVQNVIFPQPVGAGEPCTYTANPSQVFESSGTLDLAFRDTYSAALLVGNQDPATTMGSGAPAEGTEVNGANVIVRDAAGMTIGSFASLGSTFVYPEVGGVPGYAVLTLTLIDSSTGAKLQSMVTPKQDVHVAVTLTLFGTNRVGGAVQSDPFEFPIDVCDGCLVTSAPQDMSPSLPEPNCANWQTANMNAAVPCVMGQDTPVDCSQCQQLPVCRGTAPDGG